jgi:Tfp pilus assembly protein PilO
MTPRHRPGHFFIAVGLIAIVLVVAGWFTYATRRAKLSALQATLAAKQTELKNIEPEIASRPQLETEYSDLQERLAVLEPSLPNYAYVPTLLRQLERLAGETNNKIDGIKPQRARAKPTPKKTATAGDTARRGQQAAPPPPPVPYDSVDIDVGLQGTYWTTIKFLESLQKFPKMLAVNEMSVKPTSTATTGGSPQLGVQITVKAVVAKEEH